MKIIIGLALLLSTPAFADIPTELRCRNAQGEALDWNFTVVNLPANSEPGTIQGEISRLRLKEGESTFVEYSDSFAGVASSTYYNEEGSSEITVSPSDMTGIDTLKVTLTGELWDALGNPNDSEKGKVFIDPAKISISFLTGESEKRDFICSLYMPK